MTDKANKGGRPVKYKTPEEMQHIIDLYFLTCKAKQTEDEALLNELSEEDMVIVESVDDVFPSITGLALALDMTRKGLIDYENKDNPEFGNTIRKAKCRVENAVEQRLFYNNPTGSIFNLKNNFSWKDKTEQEVSGNLTINIKR